MSCFFCASSNHLSQNCDVYISHRSKKEQARLKKCCGNCLSSSHFDPSTEACQKNRKCYNCFSLDHHTFYCQYPSTGSNLFLPNIDNLLLSRFIQLLNPDEQLLLAISSPQTLCFFKNQNFTIHPKISFYDYSPYILSSGNKSIPDDNTFIVTNEIRFSSFGLSATKFLESLFIKTRVLMASIATIEDCKISLRDFLLLLSNHTKELQCRNVTITPRIQITDLLKWMPNVCRIKLYNTNIYFDKFWLKQLWDKNDETYVKKLKIDTDKFMFDGQIDYGKIFSKLS